MTLFAIAIASNLNKSQHTQLAINTLTQWGECVWSKIYEIPCRDGIGADYWNCACLLKTSQSAQEIEIQLKQLEDQAGRKRPSHDISLDVDLIAWGEDMQHMQFNPKKCPLAADVRIPLCDLWLNDEITCDEHHYKVVECEQ